MPPDLDVIVVGSGPSGVQAAQSLVEAGVTVVMLDVGFEPAGCGQMPALPFADLRRVEARQEAYFLGPDYSGVPLEPLGAAPQVTPPRQHVLKIATGHPRIVSDGFAALESHALGGLGAAWGAVAFPYLDGELLRSGLPVADMRASYERVARRIGISGAADDLLAVRGPLATLQSPLDADHNGTALLRAYEKRRGKLRHQRLYVGRPLLAALSVAQDGRAAHGGHDMDFWANHGGSIYRPELTVHELQQHPRFSYQAGWRVESFAETDRGADVIAISADGARRQAFHARRLVLAAGALGTTRIVLTSLRQTGVRVPFACNAHLYVPSVHLRQLGRPHATRCHSLAQLTMIHDPTGDAAHLVQAQMYSYRSLLLFRLLKESPLATRESLWIMRTLAPSFAIWAIEHEDEPSPRSYCVLRSDGTLQAVHPEDAAVEQRRRRDETALLKGMRQLGCWPIRRVHSGPGSSLHYGGQFPASAGDDPLTTDGGGRLRGTRGVYIVDGAALRYLPAKGLTLTLMANADRVARGVAASLRDAASLTPTDHG